MHHLPRWMVTTSVALILGTGCVAAEANIGLEIGKQAPDFKLKDQTNKEQSLSAMLKHGNVAVVFYRSADW